ncbi:MAG: 3-hydroxylacyl-ACP dehydratase, partial [Sutterellaceae bacterium]|nr:3-hydroxylacyl-ACP dehydratase [Sutterellaceae bacterium]
CRLFRMPDGRFGSWLLIELMAQTIGVFAGLKNRSQGNSPKIGFLLGTRRFETSVGFLHEGDIVDVKADCVFFGQEGLPSQFECRAEMNGNVVATANLTVYEPDDLAIWKN